MLFVSQDKKSAFSLIEILQTIILIGIIAGLSISFFRSVRTDEKLRDSTEIMLYQAIQEANRQMCSDATLFCELPAVGDNRIRGYIVDDPVNQLSCLNGTNYNNNGYCIVQKVNGNNCPAGTEEYIEADNTVNCYAIPTCRSNNQPVKPMFDGICRDGIPQWNALVQRNAVFPNINQNIKVNQNASNVTTEICYRLWDLINHKRQRATSENDLIATCVTVVNPCFADNNEQSPCLNEGNADGTNMILPNGVRLYNLSGIANNNRPTTNNPDGQNIYIKYDRNPLIITHQLGNTSSIFNAVRFGQPNNLIDDVTNLPIVPNGELADGVDPVIPNSIRGLMEIDNENPPD